MTIESAVPELLALAERMRGADWADQLRPALVAAFNAKWDWKRTFSYVARLLVTENADPRDLTAAIRNPFEHLPADPGAYERGMEKVRAVLAGEEP